MTPTAFIGIVYRDGAIVRIINPTFEEEFDGHAVGPDEILVRVPKAAVGVSTEPDSMTLEDVARITRALSWPR